MEDYAIMKNVLLHIRKFFNITFALYTCVSFGMMLLNLAFVNGEAPRWGGVALLFSQILLFSAICALAVTLVDIPAKLNRALGHLIKFVFCYGAFYLCFFALVSGTAEPINLVVLSTIFVILYAFVIVAASLVRAIFGKKKSDEDYESVYTDNK